jgi:hypothetical protein
MVATAEHLHSGRYYLHSEVVVASEREATPAAVEGWRRSERNRLAVRRKGPGPRLIVSWAAAAVELVGILEPREAIAFSVEEEEEVGILPVAWD